MRTLSPQLKSSVEAGASTLTVCLKVTPQNAPALGFTRHNDDISFEGLTYRAAPGMNVTQLQAEVGLSVDNIDTSGTLEEGIITENDILGGKYDFAEHEIFLLDFEHLDYGAMTLMKGRVYELRLRDQVFTAQLGSLGALLSQPVGALTQPRCRVKEFGDSQCKVDLNGNHPTLNLPLRTNGTIIELTISQVAFRGSMTNYPTGFFDNGKLTFTDGPNAGLSIEVKQFVMNLGEPSNIIVVQEPLLAPFAPGHAFTVTAGCSRKLSKCEEYNNVPNMRAEPLLIGMRRLLEIR